jgi:hypothetical protein
MRALLPVVTVLAVVARVAEHHPPRGVWAPGSFRLKRKSQNKREEFSKTKNQTAAPSKTHKSL